MDSRSLGWTPLVHAWQSRLPSIIQDVNKHEIMNLFTRFCPILLWFIRCGVISVSVSGSHRIHGFTCIEHTNYSFHFSPYQ